MLLLSVKMYLALLWGTSVLFSMESMSASIPATSSINSTAEPDKTTEQLITAHVAHNATETQPAVQYPTHKPAEVSVSVAAETTVLPTVETEEGTISYSSGSNDSKPASVATNTAAATASSSGPRLLRTATAVTTAGGEATPSNDVTIEGEATTSNSATIAGETTSFNDVTIAGETSSNSATIAGTATPAEDQFHHHSPTTSTDLTSSNATASTAPLAAVSSSQPTSTSQPEVTSNLSSSASPAHPTQTSAFPQNLSSPSASPEPTVMAISTSEATPVFDSTASPFTTSETSATSTQRSFTSQQASATRTHISTSEFTDPGGSSSTAKPPTILSSTESANTSTSAAGIFIPHVPKRPSIPTPKSTPATAAVPHEASKSPASTEVQACSTRGVVKHCLIAIASLAALATIFIVSTIILCTKLSGRKYKVKPQPATEMMCISALLPERTYTYTRQRNRVTNGVLVMHACGDSDEDGGDNLTLSSFLPENERSV